MDGFSIFPDNNYYEKKQFIANSEWVKLNQHIKRKDLLNKSYSFKRRTQNPFENS